MPKASDYRTVKLKTSAYTEIQALKKVMLAKGLDCLPAVAVKQMDLSHGLTVSAVVSAALAVMREKLD